MNLEGTFYHIQATVADANNRLDGRVIVRVPVPLDFIAYGMHILALDQNCNINSGLGLNWRDNNSQEFVVWHGGSQSLGTLAPMTLVAGTCGLYLKWPRHRPYYQNSVIEFVLEPEPGIGLEFSHVTITLVGERVDKIRDRARRDRLCTDPRTSGYAIFMFPPLPLDSSGTDCVRGPENGVTLQIPTLPYDFVMSGMSQMHTATATSFVPLAGGPHSEFKFLHLTNRAESGSDFTPTSMVGGQPCDDTVDAGFRLREVVTPFGIDTVVPQQTAIEALGRSLVVPGGNRHFLNLSWHGRRRPAEDAPIGWPTYQKLENAQRYPCPPQVAPCPPGYEGVDFRHPAGFPARPLPVRPPAGVPYRAMPMRTIDQPIQLQLRDLRQGPGVSPAIRSARSLPNLSQRRRLALARGQF